MLVFGFWNNFTPPMLNNLNFTDYIFSLIDIFSCYKPTKNFLNLQSSLISIIFKIWFIFSFNLYLTTLSLYAFCLRIRKKISLVAHDSRLIWKRSVAILKTNIRIYFRFLNYWLKFIFLLVVFIHFYWFLFFIFIDIIFFFDF